MKNNQKAQGLVEYALFLVLTAIVIVSILSQLGSAIGSVFCNIKETLDENEYDDPGPPYHSILNPPHDDPCSDTESDSAAASEAALTTTNLTLDAEGDNRDSLESFGVFGDLAFQQEESLDEVKILMSEGFNESLEALLEFADEAYEQALYETITMAQKQFDSGEFENALVTISDVLTNLDDFPADVQLAIVIKTEPLLIASYYELESAQVPYTAFEAALAEIELRGTGDAVEQMWVLWGLVESRNIFIDEGRPALKVIACQGITLLEDSGDPDYIELAEGYEAEIGPCE